MLGLLPEGAAVASDFAGDESDFAEEESDFPAEESGLLSLPESEDFFGGDALYPWEYQPPPLS